MEIRHTTPADLERLMEIYVHARAFMAANGNAKQWGPTNWPPRTVLEEDIALGRSYVCTIKEETGAEKVVGTFVYVYGKDIEPTYAELENGTWRSQEPYGVIHRIASEGAKGVGTFCMQWALEQSNGHMRIDTHPDNTVMQHLFDKLGFEKQGIIYVEEDDEPRYAYDYING